MNASKKLEPEIEQTWFGLGDIYNELEQIETGAFDNLKELRALRLDHNYLADINGLVSGKEIH